MIETKFNQYHLSDELLKAIEKLNFKNPTKVQEAVIPIALEKNDILCKAQTGSGKTAAFGIPICELLDWEENKPQVLVLTPTRELALQVHEDIFNIGRFKRVKVSALYGKSPIRRQEKELKQKTHVVVGTPGRVLDHIERGNFITDEIKYLIIDEADEMLNMGFIDQVEEIINELPKNRVTMLFSATLENEIQRLSQKYMNNPKIIEIEAEAKRTDAIEQFVYKTGNVDKLEVLNNVLVLENPDSCIVFCNTQERVNAIFNLLGKNNKAFEKIHGGMEQDERTQVMQRFKKGAFRYLIATDVAARGIDVHEISLVINYDVPWEKETYIHRIGRTGRRGTMGKAITLVSVKEGRLFSDIEAYTDKKIIARECPTVADVAALKSAFVEKLLKKPEEKIDKAHDLTKEITKIHINAGKKTKMRPVDIVGTLCNLEGMTAADIGVITILDVSTFVEILNNKGPQVLKELQTRNIKGRLRKVTLAEDKPVTIARKKPIRRFY
ncbi:DEAD/DEAH box helicase [Acetobacterium woodii]|uniref:ATP-dependent RNA helicase DbpA n=1 Tax=Acetobacterium woodii (strain ATCC 29683 / DSM 1030 / JCM 2381 / KCTC 1655 / WB1) TaxID=931626 RepID=H6LD96_ACEWD|nr:DEAD/DEAH box helicase [Acetobacterium woodii]AFA49141.1 putative ATP-dependent RNA helicase [Acetobacterium woodii DSM 1030]